MKNFGLYVILTNPRIGHERMTEIICVDEEIAFVQLREKNWNDSELLACAKRLRVITKGTKTKLIINDRIDI